MVIWKKRLRMPKKEVSTLAYQKDSECFVDHVIIFALNFLTRYISKWNAKKPAGAKIKTKRINDIRRRHRQPKFWKENLFKVFLRLKRFKSNRRNGRLNDAIDRVRILYNFTEIITCQISHSNVQRNFQD